MLLAALLNIFFYYFNFSFFLFWHLFQILNNTATDRSDDLSDHCGQMTVMLL